MPQVLRHTFASWLVIAGVDLPTVQKLGGLKSLAMVQRYAHLSQGHIRQAVDLLVNNSATLFTPPAKGEVTVESSNLRSVNEMGR